MIAMDRATTGSFVGSGAAAAAHAVPGRRRPATGRPSRRNGVGNGNWHPCRITTTTTTTTMMATSTRASRRWGDDVAVVWNDDSGRRGSRLVGESAGRGGTRDAGEKAPGAKRDVVATTFVALARRALLAIFVACVSVRAVTPVPAVAGASASTSTTTTTKKSSATPGASVEALKAGVRETSRKTMRTTLQGVGSLLQRIEAKTQEDWHIEDVWVLFVWNWLIRRGREKAHEALEAVKKSLNASRESIPFEGSTMDWLKAPMQLVQALFVLSYLFDVVCDMIDQLSTEWDIPEPIKVGFDKGSYTFTCGILLVMTIQKYGPNLLGKFIPAMREDAAVQLVITRLLSAFVVVATLMLTLSAFGIPAQVLFSFGGLGGLAFGLAAKDFISNLIGGLVLAVMRPFTIGEKIYLTGGGGKYRDSKEKDVSNYKVVEIGWYQTKLIPKDGKVTTIPNGYFLGANVINSTREPHEWLGPQIRIAIQDYDSVIAMTNAVREYLIKEPAVASDYKDPVVFMKKIEEDHLLVQVECFLFNQPPTSDISHKKARERVLVEIIKIVRQYCPHSPALPMQVDAQQNSWTVSPAPSV